MPAPDLADGTPGLIELLQLHDKSASGVLLDAQGRLALLMGGVGLRLQLDPMGARQLAALLEQAALAMEARERGSAVVVGQHGSA